MRRTRAQDDPSKDLINEKDMDKIGDTILKLQKLLGPFAHSGQSTLSDSEKKKIALEIGRPEHPMAIVDKYLQGLDPKTANTIRKIASIYVAMMHTDDSLRDIAPNTDIFKVTSETD